MLALWCHNQLSNVFSVNYWQQLVYFATTDDNDNLDDDDMKSDDNDINDYGSTRTSCFKLGGGSGWLVMVCSAKGTLLLLNVIQYDGHQGDDGDHG